VLSLTLADIATLYAGFDAPITTLDCGKKCAPYNENGVPFCCDTQHAVPTADKVEWQFLRTHTDLWHPWQVDDQEETTRLKREAGPNMVLLECKGAAHCQRNYRTLVCRAFPFFPYVDSEGSFIGLSYYWDYETQCWLISNMDKVTETYREQFINAYSRLFAFFPPEQDNFYHHSDEMRRIFQERRRAIPLLHRNGTFYKISPGSERMRKITKDQLPKFGPYRIADTLLFPDEQ